MKIVQGTFGNTGRISFSGDKLLINAARKSSVTIEQIASVVATTNKERKFGILGCVIGMVLLSILLLPFMGAIGVLVAVVVSIAGSFYTEKANQVEIKLKDGGWLTVECSQREMKELVNLRP